MRLQFSIYLVGSLKVKMCAVSVVYGMFQGFPDEWYTVDRINLFKRMVTDARLLDVESGQPDCEDAEKAKIAEHIDELEEQLICDYRGMDKD